VIDFNTKKLLAKPFRKFFNLGESHAPSIQTLEKRGNFVVTEKLDGSMGISFYDETTDAFYVTTKGDIDSEQGAWATPQLPKSVQDKKLLQSHTLMWEIITPKYQIVIPYEKKGYEEGLYLIGVRERQSEKLFEPAEVQAFAKEYGLRTFKTYSFPSLEAIVENAKTLPFMEEGYVIRFLGDETMVKVKSAEYLRVHRFLSNLTDKNLLDILIAGEEANVYENLGMVPEEYRDHVDGTLKNYQKEALIFKNTCYKYFAECMAGIRPDDLKVDRWKRKAFAAEVQKQPEDYRGYLFRLLDGEDPKIQMIYQSFRKWNR
jgi:tRNA splicing ligase